MSAMLHRLAPGGPTALLVVACASAAFSTASTAPSSEVLSEAQLRARLADWFGPLWHCQSDLWPTREGTSRSCIERWPEVAVDASVLAAIATQYADGEAFDLLASGPTGAYRIDGTWLASTLLR
jgi:hypothetical protein